MHPPEMQAEVESIGLNMAIAVARNIGSKTYLQGVMDLAGLMENPGAVCRDDYSEVCRSDGPDVRSLGPRCPSGRR